eukprot:CAMPEP_0197576992 /NCGR_PEP_ID=MMETSP1326-20131121/1787_1 /TAXON_ID=1155430 /ORGANISM="Genus nov. species nov., Strain RCC2288" /LENGTH=475 /DNA_ID=CAMNT_0043139983 /DNA_START=68 /DNA_END=1492 /DNA_ORIENTATION=-
MAEVSSLPRAMVQLVADPEPPVEVPNPMHSRVYATVGGNSTFSVTPPVMHFGGYTLGKVHRQRFVVTNHSNTSKRLHVIVPGTSFFKATCEKRGLMAPGMSEVITVEFCPTEVRYFYDCVRIHNEDENLLVPIHAYPVMNEAVFPRAIDFGKCGVMHRQVKRISLRCKVPIAFEYELLLSTESKVFDVQPRKGIVPANGEIAVEVSFTPNKLITSTLEILVKISQFNFEPFTCVVTGTGFPSVTRDQGVSDLLEGSGDRDFGHLVEGTVGMSHAPGAAGFGAHGGIGGGAGAAAKKGSRSATVHSLSATFNRTGGAGGLGNASERKQKGSGGGGGGAGGGDAYTEYVHRSRREANAAERHVNASGDRAMMHGTAPLPPSAGGPRHVKLSDSLGGGAHSHSHFSLASTASDFNALPMEPEEEMVDGVYVPSHIAGHATVNYVLMQRRGKLRIKDLKSAVAAKNEENEALEGSMQGA